MTREKRIRSIALISGLNGWSVSILACACLCISVLMGSIAGALVCLAIGASGAMELTGRHKLKQNSADAAPWLTASQSWLLFVIICYGLYQLFSFDLAKMFARLSPADRAQITALLQNNAPLIETVYRGFYLAVMAASLLYQGGLWLYYRKNLGILFPPE